MHRKPANSGSIRVKLGGESIKAVNDRYKLFFTKGYTCALCGLVGTVWKLEKPYPSHPYLVNLYGVRKDGTEVLMNKDHIVPNLKSQSPAGGRVFSGPDLKTSLVERACTSFVRLLTKAWRCGEELLARFWAVCRF